VGYPTTEQGLFTRQPRKFKYKKAVSIESTTGKILLVLIVAVLYVRFTTPMTFCVLSTLINS
jgi:hypothetical protein